MFVNLVKNAVDYLPEEFQKTELNYVKIVYGKNELTPRWKHCTWEAERCCRFGTSPKPLTCLVLD
jgi:predicted metalloendopeptidase